MQSCGSIPLHGTLPLLPHMHRRMASHSKPKCTRCYQKVPGRAALLLPVMLSLGTCPLQPLPSAQRGLGACRAAGGVGETVAFQHSSWTFWDCQIPLAF